MIGSLFNGQRVRLTALKPEDAAVMARWYEDGEFSRLWDAMVARPRTEASIRKWFEETDASKDGYGFGIRLMYSDELIGYLYVDGIVWNHGAGWLAIAIGEAANRGKGYGLEAMNLALKFAFHELNLHRIQLTVFGYNERAIRLYEKIGFQREGTIREFLARDGRRYDMYLYGLLKREWDAGVRQD
ncbi:MAG: GNAT family N-acetyltransferase [Chloroflexi bacterium]|nr:GNAT family N-acetyltransferase [Chloroflexota bacterium]